MENSMINATENTAAALDALNAAMEAAPVVPAVVPAQVPAVVAPQKADKLGGRETALLAVAGLGGIAIVGWAVYGGIKLARKVKAKKALAQAVIDAEETEQCPDYVEVDGE